MSFKIYYDDWRDPSTIIPVNVTRGLEVKIYTEAWVVTRTLEEFKAAVCALADHGISHVSFDFDMDYSDRINGDVAAIWMKQFYIDLNLPLPIILIHSTNVKGTALLKSIFE